MTFLNAKRVGKKLSKAGGLSLPPLCVYSPRGDPGGHCAGEISPETPRRQNAGRPRSISPSLSTGRKWPILLRLIRRSLKR